MLFREKDWSATSLGPPENWSREFRAILATVLESGFPTALLWGPEFLNFYNDAYRKGLGADGRHPRAFGAKAKEVWPELWDEIGPMLQLVMDNGTPIWHRDRPFTISRDGRMEDTYWTFSYTKAEAESLKVPDVDAIYDHKRFEALFAMAQSTDVPVFNTVHRSKDSNMFPVEVKVSGFDFQGKPHMLGIAREISERKKAEENLRENEQRFRELADQSPMWIWMTDAEVNVEYANRELLDYIGIDEISDFTGQVWKDIVHPGDIGTVFEGFGEAVEKRRGFSVDYRVRKAETGLYEWFTVKGVPRFEGKTLAGFIGTGMNVHRQKTFSEQLSKEVAMRTKELADTNTELAKSNKELQSFAYISSHDLQEPLRKIQTFCSLLLATEYEKLSEKGRDKFYRMNSAANRMQVLINDLLAYSRLDTEERNFETTDLASIVNEVKTDLEDEINAKDATVNIESSCEIDIVHFQFRQLLYNLISNSLKYSREGVPPVIQIGASPIHSSDISDDRPIPGGDYVCIKVSDNGIGFANSYTDKIFEVFQRLHGREKDRGTGVGLAIVKKIAENHKGFVTAKGEPDLGAVFEIYLPIRNTSPDTGT